MSDELWLDLMDCINTTETRMSQAKEAVRRAQYKLEELEVLLDDEGSTKSHRDKIRILLLNVKMFGDAFEKYADDVSKLKEAV